jgi:hypothetical protein
MPKSRDMQRKVLNGIFRTTALAQVATHYVALASADLTVDNVTANELPASNGYARIAITRGDAQWVAPSNSALRSLVTNVNALTGPTTTGNLNGGSPIGFFGIYDALTAGNLVYCGALGTPVTILSGQVISIPAGAIQVSEG